MGVYDGGNTTGFVSPASGSIEAPIDLAEILDLRRPSRYPVLVEGDALVARGVQSGDILVVDTDTRPTHGSMAIVMIHGSVIAGQLAYRHGFWWLESGRSEIRPVRIEGEGAEIWGVAVALVRMEV
jgi:DNA polymerase V